MSESENGNIKKSNGYFLTSPRFSILILINIIILIVIGWATSQSKFSFFANSMAADDKSVEGITVSSIQEPTQTFAPPSEEVATAVPTEAPLLDNEPTAIPGLIILALSDFGYTHLFAYQPETLPLTRLTLGDWDDIHPALSPDGRRIAFSSHRGGQWDLYIMDIASGDLTQITDDLAYDGSPDWSPDGLWLTYESYVDNNLEIFIIQITGENESKRITNNAALDFAPRWSSNGRKIAFTSNRVGANDIWIVDLDKVSEDRMINFTRNPTVAQEYAEWSPDGSEIAWVSKENGVASLFKKSVDENIAPTYIGFGDLPIWSPNGDLMLAPSLIPDNQYISIYSVEGNSISVPPMELPGRADGITWGENKFPTILPKYIQDINGNIQPPPGAESQGSDIGAVTGRQFTIDLVNVEAPFPQLNALAIDSFYSLRNQVVIETGWDVLSSLENAFVPITQPLEPGRENDWLFTGRAFTLPPVLIDVGWMVVVMEEHAGLIYWRVFIRAITQDGSLGRPMHQFAWDFNARFTGNTTYYEQGGAPLSNVAPGYWIDFTSLAISHGWERLAALSNWRSLFHSARFNEFVITSGLEWEQAILQLYPPEILATPNPANR